jgi:hypothetical protein
VLVDDADEADQPRVLVFLEHAIADARPSRAQPHTVVSRRFEFVEIPRGGEPRTAGYAPYLDYRAPTEDELDRLEKVLASGWLETDLEALGREHAIEVAVPEHLAKVRLHTESRVDATIAAVKERLTREINYWDHRANELQLRADSGKTPQMNVDRARQRADRIADRLQTRLGDLQAERALRAMPPVVVGGALVVPARLLGRAEATTQRVPDTSVIARQEVERRAIAAVLAAEEKLGRIAEDLNETQRNHPGYDVRSFRRGTQGWPSDVRHIEVKGRVAGAPTVTVSRNEILTSMNEPDRFILALVEVSSTGDTVRYLRQPFKGRSEDFVFEVTSVNFTWSALWDRSAPPS